MFSSRFIDLAGSRVNACAMESDDLPRIRREDASSLLAREDLAPLSVAELEQRIARLEAEITRTRAHAERAVNHRASADALFRR